MGFSRIYFIGAGGGGGGGDVTKAIFPITQADLVGGVFTALHNLNQAFVTFQLYDDAGEAVAPDEGVASGVNTFLIELTSFEPIPGTWHLIVTG